MATQQKPFLALGLRLLAMVAMSVMLLFSKLTGTYGLPLPETLFWRQMLPALGILGWLALRGELGRLKTQRFWVHLRRAFIGTAGMFTTLGVVRILPLAEATILSFTTPMFAVVLAALFLREAVGPWRWGAVLLGLVGVLVIVGPDRAHMPVLGVAVGLTAAFSVALVSIQLRDLGRTEEPLTVVFYFSALGALMLLPGAVVTGGAHTRFEWLLLAGIGATGLVTQLLLTAALRYGSVASVIVMDYSQLIWSTLWGFLFFQQLPPATSWLGAPLIITAGLVIAWREHVLHRRTPIDPAIPMNAD
ncbi:DMT family transporter [Novosphingobium sp.]|uniref:DMT family transporter n=1 Tax=Novosphingobium sp. TaxID=1874826 RepID=UPI00260403F3|nr:DMT family transporter [Novosphingobium sp.]